MMMKWRIKGMKNIHNLRGLGLNLWMGNVDIHANICQCLDQPSGSTPKACNVATLLWPSVRVKPNTWKKSEDLESSRTPECLEFDNKAQNTSH
jgi:hypothetical protein